jgi:hypothetical protein
MKKCGRHSVDIFMTLIRTMSSVFESVPRGDPRWAQLAGKAIGPDDLRSLHPRARKVSATRPKLRNPLVIVADGDDSDTESGAAPVEPLPPPPVRSSINIVRKDVEPVVVKTGRIRQFPTSRLRPDALAKVDEEEPRSPRPQKGQRFTWDELAATALKPRHGRA